MLNNKIPFFTIIIFIIIQTSNKYRALKDRYKILFKIVQETITLCRNKQV